jgi:hypothetical protein
MQREWGGEGRGIFSADSNQQYAPLTAAVRPTDALAFCLEAVAAGEAVGPSSVHGGGFMGRQTGGSWGGLLLGGGATVARKRRPMQGSRLVSSTQVAGAHWSGDKFQQRGSNKNH